MLIDRCWGLSLPTAVCPVASLSLSLSLSLSATPVRTVQLLHPLTMFKHQIPSDSRRF